MEMRNFRPFDSPPSRIPLASARSPAEKNPGNDSAAVPGVWQPSSPKRKLNFIHAALAGSSALIKDNVPRKAYDGSTNNLVGSACAQYLSSRFEVPGRILSMS